MNSQVIAAESIESYKKIMALKLFEDAYSTVLDFDYHSPVREMGIVSIVERVLLEVAGSSMKKETLSQSKTSVQ